MPLSDIVNVQITRQTQTVSEQGFGIPLILGTSKNFNDLLRKYSNMQQVAADFEPYDLEYIAAQDVFAQTVTPQYIYIGRRQVATVGIEVETALPAEEYTVTINGTDVFISSTTSVTDSIVTLSGIITSVITFDIPFDSGNSTVVTLNGLPLSAVPFDTDNATTLFDIATEIALNASVTSAVSNGTDAITVTFVTASSAIVNSAITTGGASQPVATITYEGPLVTNNLINVSLNGEILGTVTSYITYSTSFTAGTSTITIINGVAGSAVLYDTDNATTLFDIASQIAGVSGIASATSNGTDTITVVFTASGNNTVNSSITTGGSAPTATISEGGFAFDTDSLTTMTNIATAAQVAINVGYTPGIGTSTVSGVDSNILTITSNPNQAGVIDFFTVTLGASQATAVIVNTIQPTDKNTVADALTTAINDASLGVTATTPATPNGTFSISADVSTVPYTIAISTTIINPDQARVTITQANPNQAYTCIIGGNSYTYQAPYNVVDNEQIAAGLVALINSGTSPVSASDNLDGSFEIIANTPGKGINLQVNPLEQMTIQFGLIIDPYTPSTAVVNDLQAIQNINDDWYALACTDRTVATVKAIAAWIETQVKIFGTASDDLNIINQDSSADNTSIAYYFKNLGYVRSFVIYHAEAASDFPECAWFGSVLPLTPGSETWAFKQLANITYSDLTSNQENNAFSKNCNTYEFVGGVGITQNGTVAVGEYIDIVRGVDWLTSTIQVYVYSILVNFPKVPYTDSGITAVEAQIRRALQLGVDNNFIAADPPYQIFVPKAVNVPAIDKTNRILRNVSFNATLAGAIQAVKITGTVSV